MDSAQKSFRGPWIIAACFFTFGLSTGFPDAVAAEAQFVEGDIGDRGLVGGLIEERGIDAVVHMAASVVVYESVAKPLAYYENNTVKTRNLLASCLERGAHRFIQLLRWGDPRDFMGRTRRILESLDCPVFVIHGRKDPAIPLRFAAEAARLAPRGALEVMDARHFIPIDEPEVLSRHLRSFLCEQHAVHRRRHALSSEG